MHRRQVPTISPLFSFIWVIDKSLFQRHALVFIRYSFRPVFAEIKYFVLSPDINECTTHKHRCSQLCHNTDGSYRCSCLSGYILAPDHMMCNGKLVQKLKKCIFILIWLLPVLFFVFTNKLCKIFQVLNNLQNFLVINLASIKVIS